MSRALVISGGGSKGAFAVGVVRELQARFPKLQFDLFVGTSTGSLIVPLVAINKTDLLEQLYTSIKTENVVTKLRIGDRINEHSIFDATPLWNLLNQYFPNDSYSQLVSLGRKIYINATCLQTGELTVFTTDTHAAPSVTYDVKMLTGADHFRKALLASSCEPVFMPPVQVNASVPGEQHPDYQFVDGGVKKYAGIQTAIDNGATEIFTILLNPEKEDPTPGVFSSLVPILERTIDIFTTQVGRNDVLNARQFNQALTYIQAVKTKMINAGLSRDQVNGFFHTGNDNLFQDKAPLKLFFIRPETSLGGGPGGLNFDPAEMKTMLETGRAAARKFISALPPGDLTWA